MTFMLFDIAPGHPFHGPYHDKEYGFPATDESILFERLSLEIFQAGLSWLIVLKKREGFKIAFKDFDVGQLATFTDDDVERLLDLHHSESKKNQATIYNAQQIIAIRDSHGGFAAWIECHHPLSKEEWVKLFKKTFKFTGGEIVNEFLMSIGYLQGAHRSDCPIFEKITAIVPAWQKTQQ